MSTTNQQIYDKGRPPPPIAASAGGEHTNNIQIKIYLNEAINRVREYAYYMNRSMEDYDALELNLAHVLDHASKMLVEMCTRSLAPKEYYELFLKVVDELGSLEDYFEQLVTTSGNPSDVTNAPDLKKMEYIYEVVQYCPKVIPRIYLQVTAGAVYMKLFEDKTKNILEDLLRVLKCVQCPLRGLFLRDYFSKCTKETLVAMGSVPSVAAATAPVSEDETPTKIVQDSPAACNLIHDQTPIDEKLEDGHKDNEFKTALSTVDNNKNDQDSTNQKESTKNDDDTSIFTSFEAKGLNNEEETVESIKSSENIQKIKEKDEEATMAVGDLNKLSNEKGVTALTVTDACKYIMHNLIEMNKLWVRIQHMGVGGKEQKKRRERERSDLRDLIGNSLIRLSQMDAITPEMYKGTILPQMLEQILLCRDTLAQAYLMDCLIQVFPDEFHLQTLNSLIDTIPKLKDKVNVRTILESIMNRLASFSGGDPQKFPFDAFDVFDKCIVRIVDEKEKLPPKEIVRLSITLLNFGMVLHPEELLNIDHCLGKVKIAFLQKNISKPDAATVDELSNLLSIPFEKFGLKVLQLDNYVSLRTYLSVEKQQSVASVLLKSVVSMDNNSFEAMTCEAKMVEQLFDVILPLYENENSYFTENKSEISKLIGKFGAKNEQKVDTLFEIYKVASKSFAKADPLQIESILVSLVFATMLLSRKIVSVGVLIKGIVSTTSTGEIQEEKSTPKTATQRCKEVFVFLQKTVASISKYNNYLGLKLLLECALAADNCAAALSQNDTKGAENVGSMGCEFISQSFLVYDEFTNDSNLQYQSIIAIISTLLQSRSLNILEYEGLITKATQTGAKLIRKTDQCKAIIQCSYLFFKGSNEKDAWSYHKPQRVLECLQRALKLANICVTASSSNIGLFIDILDVYVYYFERENPAITDKFISGLVALINEHLDNSKDFSDAIISAQAHYGQILRHINLMKSDSSMGERFRPIVCGNA